MLEQQLDQIIGSISKQLFTVVTFEDCSWRSSEIESGLAKLGLTVVSTGDHPIPSPTPGIDYVCDHEAIVRIRRGDRIDVLVINDVSSWTTSQEVLLATLRNSSFKVVMIAGEGDVPVLRNYFGEVSHIHVGDESGTTLLDPLNVGKEQTYQNFDLVECVCQSLNQGLSCLVIVAGKQQVEEFMQLLSDAQGHVVKTFRVFPLHGECSALERKAALGDCYPIKVVVATNLCERLPVPGINVIFDTGMVNRRRVVEGVDGLHPEITSLLERKRRMRASSGDFVTYFECLSPDMMGQFGARLSRRDQPEPEIYRVFIDKEILRLMAAGISMSGLRLVHQPKPKELDAAMQKLQRLGCVANGRVTEIGRQALELPTTLPIGRMILEAMRLGVLDDIIDVAAILQVQGILDVRPVDLPVDKLEGRSDIFLQLEMFRKGELVSENRHTQWKITGINPNRMIGALRTKGMILKQLGRNLSGPNRLDRPIAKPDVILKAICAAMTENIFWSNGKTLTNLSNRQDERVRRLDRNSQLAVETGDMIVGIPLNLSGNRISPESGGHNVALVILASRIRVEWLEEIAPDIFRCEKGSGPHYRSDVDQVWSETSLFMGERMLNTVTVHDPEHRQANTVIASWLARMTDISDDLDERSERLVGRSRFAQIIKRNRAYLEWSDSKLTVSELRSHYLNTLQGARSFGELPNPEALLLFSKEQENSIGNQQDAIKFLGIWRRVRYEDGTLTIRLSQVDLLDGSWREIPDGELRLPDESIVEVAFRSYSNGCLHQKKDLAELRMLIAKEMER